VLADAFRTYEMDLAVNAIANALTAGKIENAKLATSSLIKWRNQVLSQEDERKNPKVSPEQKKFIAEKDQFYKAQRQETTKGIANEGQKLQNAELATHLREYLKLPFFKGLPKETLQALGSDIVTTLQKTLQADKTYQTQMKALWGAKTPDREKLLEYHKNAVRKVARDVVSKTVSLRYPSYAKGGSAAGRIAAADAKKSHRRCQG
jgi:hypothetical protein